MHGQTVAAGHSADKYVSYLTRRILNLISQFYLRFALSRNVCDFVVQDVQIPRLFTDTGAEYE